MKTITMDYSTYQDELLKEWHEGRKVGMNNSFIRARNLLISCIAPSLIHELEKAIKDEVANGTDE